MEYHGNHVNSDRSNDETIARTIQSYDGRYKKRTETCMQSLLEFKKSPLQDTNIVAPETALVARPDTNYIKDCVGSS